MPFGRCTIGFSSIYFLPVIVVNEQDNSIIGFASAVMLCLCSGLAGVFFELMLKVRRTEIDDCGLYALG